jgi:hypothetical protein
MSGIAMGARKASARIGAPTPKRSQPTQANLTGGRMRHEEIARVAFYKWDKRQSCSAQRLQWRRWAAGLSCNAHGGWQQVRSARAGRATGWVGSAQHQAPRITGTSDRGARLDESGGGVVLLELLDVRQ